MQTFEDALLSIKTMTKSKLSVVIASCVGPPFITKCLKSLEQQCVNHNVDCIVVDRAGGDVAKLIQKEFPRVTFVSRPPDESVPDLRRYGISLSKSEYVAIIEEHCVAKEDWISTILGCLNDSVAAIGGIVEDANYTRSLDWAVYFTEYNSYMPPVE